MKTFIPKNVNKKWFLIDVQDKRVGHIATKIADILRGKNKAIFTPHLDAGDNVVIINVDKIQFSGNKLENKRYYRHSGYMGGLKTTKASDLFDKNPEKILFSAVKGMLPKNKLQKVFLKKLHIYSGTEHKHEAQKPETLQV